MIVVRAGSTIPEKVFLFWDWVPVDVAANFAGAVVKAYAYLDQMVAPAGRIVLPAVLVAPNRVDVDASALAAGKYGLVIQVSNAGLTQFEFWPAKGSALLVVGEAA